MKTEHNTNVNSDLSALSIIHLILREQYLKPQLTHRLSHTTNPFIPELSPATSVLKPMHYKLETY